MTLSDPALSCRYGEPLTLFRQVDVDTAEEFLDVFTPHRKGSPLYDRPANEGWIFRGQANAEWSLTPSAHRGIDPFLKFRFAQADPIKMTDEDRMYAEEYFALDYANHVSHLGYEVPFDSAKIRDHDLADEKHDGTHFPPSKHRGIYALAQHYGIPTRLLDWSLRAMPAIYFAARGACDETDKPDRLAVWALQRAFVSQFCRKLDPGVVIVTVPQTTNPNLRSQSGLFTLVRFQTIPAMGGTTAKVPLGGGRVDHLSRPRIDR